ncbi:hypothetical protein WA538_005524 [Blastocystis sp. DL]
MSIDCKTEAKRATELIDSILSKIVAIGNGDAAEDQKNMRDTKMELLRLKSTSRLVFEDVQKAMDSIEGEMEKADKVLIDVYRLESEISNLNSTNNKYKSFKTPQFDSIHLSPPDEASSGKSLFEIRCEGLQEELKERKRLKEQLDSISDVKKQRMMVTVQLKHRIQNEASKMMEEAEAAILKASESCLEVVNKEDENASEESKSDNESTMTNDDNQTVTSP